MGLFKSADQKEAERQEKERRVLEKYNLTALTDPDDIESVRKIVSELTGTGLMEMGATLGGGSEKDFLKLQMYYLRAIVEQNCIIIRQLDRLIKAIEK